MNSRSEYCVHITHDSSQTALSSDLVSFAHSSHVAFHNFHLLDQEVKLCRPPHINHQVQMIDFYWTFCTQITVFFTKMCTSFTTLVFFCSNSPISTIFYAVRRPFFLPERSWSIGLDKITRKEANQPDTVIPLWICGWFNTQSAHLYVVKKTSMVLIVNFNTQSFT